MDEDGEQCTLDSGLQELTVEVDELTYNPLDDEGFQKLDVGDRVSVQGSVDADLFEGQVFEANYVTTLYSES